MYYYFRMLCYIKILRNILRTLSLLKNNKIFNSAIEADVIENATQEIRQAALMLSEKGTAVDPQLLHSAVEHQILHALSKHFSNYIIRIHFIFLRLRL